MAIVGAGEAGVRAAFALREGGWAGRIVLLGAESAPPYDRPSLSKKFLAQELGDDEVAPICSATDLAAAGVEYWPAATVGRIDRRNHQLALVDGRTLTYERLLLATGAEPRALAGSERSAQAAVTYLRSRDDAATLRRRLDEGSGLVVVGGGLIGLEVASVAAQRGCDVVILEAEGRLLRRVAPAVISDLLATRHAAAGVQVIVNARVERVRTARCTTSVALEDGRAFAADTVLVALGSVPRTELAKRSGLLVENGVVVDERLNTSDPEVFAAGDCCSFPSVIFGGERMRMESWRSAQAQGTVAAQNMLGLHETFTDVPWFWSDQYDLTLQVAGLSGRAVTEAVRPTPGEFPLWFGLDSGGRVAAAAGVGVGNAVARDIKIAERLIANGVHPKPSELQDPSFRLRSLLG